MSCRFFHGLFGPGSAAVPVWGAMETLARLANALETGLSVSDQTSTTGSSEAYHATEVVIGWLQRSGKAPYDLHRVAGLSDEQRAAHGFEPKSAVSDPAASVQNMGVPPFQELDMTAFLAGLRVVARYQELLTGRKPVFQVGVLTLTVQGIDQQFFAQTLMAEAGEATDTIWLYRWCTMGFDGRYDEHWRPFDGLTGIVPHSTVALHRDQTMWQNAPKRSVVSNQLSAISESTCPPEHQQQLPKKQRAPKHKRYEHFQHHQMSDDELFAAPADLLQGDAILRLAYSYSNQVIFNRINAARLEGTGIKSVNVITKRLTHAIQAAAETSGRSVQDIRAEITAAKSLNGVRHKGKVDVAPYT